MLPFLDVFDAMLKANKYFSMIGGSKARLSLISEQAILNRIKKIQAKGPCTFRIELFLGIIFQVGKAHEEMDKIARLLPYVSHKDEVVEIIDSIDPSKLLPGKCTFAFVPTFDFFTFVTRRVCACSLTNCNVTSTCPIYYEYRLSIRATYQSTYPIFKRLINVRSMLPYGTCH